MHDIPVWVYFLFFGLLYIGIRRCFTTTLRVKRFIVLPIALLFFSLYDFYEQMLHVPVSIFIWISAFLLTLSLGAYYVRHRKIEADKRNRLIKIPGDVSILILILIMFSVEFFVNFSKATQASYVDKNWFILIISLISGLMIGFTSGRNLMYFIKYMRAESVNLSE